MSNDINEQELKKTLGELGLTVDWQRPITPDDITYLLEKRPFIQLTTADGGVTTMDPPTITIAKTGWVIINYGDAICSAAGNQLYNYGGMPYRLGGQEPNDEGDETDWGEPIGTIHGQVFNTALELVELAKKQGWHNIHIIDGMPKMIWATWHNALKSDMTVSNYSPTKDDEEYRQRLLRSEIDDQRYAKRIKSAV